ncbi:tetratricopeptide repeat protein [Gemmatimonas sp.]|jgi:hypothetical protein|uniref:tetratricopeptide repeat protein n=1 Tax=Gemmatimonas sp. TaxID=1962908 RepID=UPI0037BFA2D8
MKGSMWTRALGATLMAAGMPMLQTLTAQATCNVNDGSPFQLAGAKQYVIKAANSRNDDEIPKHLANAIRLLTDTPEKIKNEAGRQYLLLRTFAQFRARNEGTFVLKRSDMGYTANPQGTQNLLLAVDTAATALIAVAPQCAEASKAYRQQFYGDVYNKAISALQAEQDDSAAYYSRIALLVGGSDPRPWNILNAVYQKQNQMDSSMMAMEKIITLSGGDTLYLKLKQQNRYNLAVMKLQAADAATGAAKDDGIKQARTLLEAFLKDTPGDANAAQALGRALRMSGDTAAVANMFTDMLKDPARFTADQLFEAGSNAAAGGRDADAVKLFEAGFTKNPHHRFALYNYANVLFAMKDNQRMGPAVQRLMTVDPNFERGWRLMAGYWQNQARAEQDAAKKKVFNDSVLFYLDKQSKTNPKVDITLAQKAGPAFTLQGSVVNGGEAAGSWTMKLEFLDASGATVTSKDVAIGPVEPGSGTTFSVKIEDPKVVAFRYAPLK